MTYDLAKGLKDAGFPQDQSVFVYVQRTKKNKIAKGGEWSLNLSIAFLKSSAVKTNPNWYAAPTLEELIDACGEEFVAIRNWQRENKRFGNGYKLEEDGLEHYIAESSRVESGRDGTSSWVSANGATPTEAVARLYIALNRNTIQA